MDAAIVGSSLAGICKLLPANSGNGAISPMPVMPWSVITSTMIPSRAVMTPWAVVKLFTNGTR
jgi:hypothetical protein